MVGKGGKESYSLDRRVPFMKGGERAGGISGVRSACVCPVDPRGGVYVHSKEIESDEGVR